MTGARLRLDTMMPRQAMHLVMLTEVGMMVVVTLVLTRLLEAGGLRCWQGLLSSSSYSLTLNVLRNTFGAQTRILYTARVRCCFVLKLTRLLTSHSSESKGFSQETLEIDFLIFTASLLLVEY